MMQQVRNSLWIGASVVLLLCMGCDSGSETTPAQDGDVTDVEDANEAPDQQEVETTEEESGPVKLDAITSATPLGASGALKSTHSGWKKAACFSCHENPHKNGLKTVGCVTCHGTNGATTRPAGHTAEGCVTCHAAKHAAAQFVEGDCQACHKFAESNDCPAEVTADVIVIGAGGGGLAAAATIARAGKKVVLIEKHNKVGGYMTTFKRGDYTFEISLHAMGGMDDPDTRTSAMFKSLGVWEQLKPLKLEPMYKIITPDFEMVVPSDPMAFKALLIAQFPAETDGINRLFDDLIQFDKDFEELAAAKAAGGAVWDEYFANNKTKALKLLSYQTSTLTDVLADYFTDQKLHMVFTQLASYAGTEPDDISAGFYYFEGGSQTISDALAAQITDNGGTIRLNTLVDKILIEKGAVAGVHTVGEACYKAPYVISNANALSTYLSLVGTENLEETFVEELQGMSIGLTGFAVYLGLDADVTPYFDGAHEIFINESYDQHKNFSYVYQCTTDLAPLLITNYSLSDTTAAPEGHNVVAITAELDYSWSDTWNFYTDRELYHDLKDEVAKTMIYRAEQVIPGLSDHIVVKTVATPPTLERFTLNPKGTFFGFHSTPDQALLMRLPQESPIPGLYLAGAWTFPGPGQSAVLQSGVTAGNLVLKAMATPTK